jgi:hypothetical protein
LVCGLVLVITAVPGEPGGRRLLSSSPRRGTPVNPAALGLFSVRLRLMVTLRVGAWQDLGVANMGTGAILERWPAGFQFVVEATVPDRYPGRARSPATRSADAGKAARPESLHGFWIFNWLKIPGNRERLTAIYEEIAPLVVSGAISIPVAGQFTLDQYVEALELATKLQGKAIFYPNR